MVVEEELKKDKQYIFCQVIFSRIFSHIYFMLFYSFPMEQVFDDILFDEI